MGSESQIYSLKQYREIFRKINLIVLLHDNEGKILEANEKMLLSLGYDESEIDFLSVYDILNSSDKTRYTEFIENTLCEAASTSEFTIKKRSGESIPVNVSSNLVKIDGREIIVCVMDEITKLKKAEQELREKNSFIDSIIENIPNMIFVKDAQELRFVRFNKAGEDLLGLPREQMLGKNDYDLFPEKEADFFTNKDRAVLKSGELMDISEEEIHTKFRGIRTLHTKKITINDEYEIPKYLLGISEDVTERIESAEEIKRSLKEKESLLREIHHRVKNNLQVISSLLSLQSDYVTDKDTLRLFQESQNRIYTIALIHEQLYQSDDLALIDIKNYIKELTANLKTVYGDEGHSVKVEVDSQDIAVNIDTAIPCGLIINELFSNSFKHAFTNGNGNRPIHNTDNLISVAFQSDKENGFVLSVKDNGKGLPPGLDYRNTETLGLQLVSTLTDQLKGKMEVEQGQGCAIRITFPSS